MKNKKGFTLIELLAVIVVLAIIMVIATIQINKTIKKSRKNAFDSAFENLKKEIKQRIVTGDEYLCYDGDRSIENDTKNNVFFGNYFFGICGNGPHNNDTNSKITNDSNGLVYLTGARVDAGTKYCQDIYDISDDYHMWVQYQYTSGDITLLLSATNNSKFKGVGYKSAWVDEIGEIKNANNTSTLDNDKFTIDYNVNEGKLAGVHISMEDCKSNGNKCECTYNEDYHIYNSNGKPSYECSYQWKSDKENTITNNIKNNLEKAGVADEKDNNLRIITAYDACEILTNPLNWE